MGRALDIEDCVNTHCPWSGKPVSRDALMIYKGNIVGFCKSGCRDKFEKALVHFEGVIGERHGG